MLQLIISVQRIRLNLYYSEIHMLTSFEKTCVVQSLALLNPINMLRIFTSDQPIQNLEANINKGTRGTHDLWVYPGALGSRFNQEKDQ